MQYRKLKLGEVLQEGDQFRSNGKWINAKYSKGHTVLPHSAFRRPLTPEETANLFREKLADLMEEFGVDYISVDVVTNFYYRTKEGDLPIYLDWGTLSPGGIRESITSPETGATENQ